MNIRILRLTPVLLLIILAFGFLSKPILNVSNYYYSSANLSQFYGLTKSNYEPSNLITFDIYQVYNPSLILSVKSFFQKELPLWNPYNGLGVPLLANYATAILSPFNLPAYFVDFQSALILSVLAKLLLSSLGMYFFLRLWNIHEIGALTGAIAYTYSGYIILSLQWTPSGVAASLPTVFYFTTRFLKEKVHLKYSWGVVISLFIGLQSAHPESFYAGLLLLSTYLLFIAGAMLQSDFSRSNRKIILSKLSMLIILGVLAAGLASYQLIPFLEYAFYSGGIVERANKGLSLARQFFHLPLWVYPDLLGNFSTPPYVFPELANSEIPIVPGPIVHGLFVGSICLLLATSALLTLPQKLEPRFFTGALIIYFVYAYRPFNIDWLVSLIPGLSHLPSSRADLVFTFCMACLVAYGTDYLVNEPNRSRQKFLFVLIYSIVMLTTATIGAYLLIQYYFLNTALYNTWKASWEQVGFNRQIIQIICFFLALVSVAALQFKTPKKAKYGLQLILLLALFAQTGFFFRNYFPLTHQANFYPITHPVQKLQNIVGKETLAFLCEDHKAPGLPPNSNIVYAIKTIAQYETLNTYYYPRLINRLFSKKIDNTSGYLYCINRYDPAALNILGVSYILASNELIKGQPNNTDIVYEKVADIIPDYGIYKSSVEAHKFRIVPNAELVTSDEQALDKLNNSNFLPLTKVLIHPTHSIQPSVINTSPLDQKPNTQLLVKDEFNNETRLKITNDLNGAWLVINIAYYPGWKAYIDNQEVPVYRANYAFHAIQIPTGDHEIIFRYEPLSFKVGVIVSLISLILLVFIGIWIQRKHRI